MPLDTQLLQKHIKHYLADIEKNPERAAKDHDERLHRIEFYQSYTSERIMKMSIDEMYEYFSKLWAMLIWGNKRYVVDKMISENGVEPFKKALSDLLWQDAPIENRWDNFRKKVKGVGPAMMSELLCHCHPQELLLWNRRAYVGLNFLGVDDLPNYNYQATGKWYAEICKVGKKIAQLMEAEGVSNPNLLTVDYFIWDQLQVEENLSNIHKSGNAKGKVTISEKDVKENTEFIHNEVRDKLADIGQWLGLQSQIEVKVADGAVVDVIWESTIGNMGRVIYVFEVQAKGSIDGLLLNLLKAMKNPAVQGVVAVSDINQIQKIEREASGLKELEGKLKLWDFEKVLDVHESLASVNEAINALGLVPQGF